MYVAGFFGDVMLIQLERFEEQDGLALHQRGAHVACDPRHFAAVGRIDQMLHLHGFEHGNLLARTHEFAFADIDRDDGALQRRRHRNGALGTGRGLDRLLNRSIVVAFRHRRQRDLPGRSHEIGDMRIDKTGADAVGGKIGMRQHRRQERDIGVEAADAKLTQGP